VNTQNPKRRIAFTTLGCRVNQYDGQALLERSQDAGFRQVPFHEPADVYVINTCTVTASADTEGRQWVRKAKAANPSSLVVVTGCLAQDRPEEMAALPGVDLVVGNDQKAGLVPRILAALGQDDPNWPLTGEVSPWLGGISRFEGHRRAFLKVQDGCDFGCSFCLIPRVRGDMVSRPAGEILEEGKRLAGQGVKELVLAGIQLSSYGRDLGCKVSEARLAPVVEALLALPGVRRVRLSSYAVADFEDALLPLFGKGLCAHLHLPLQSGDAGVLKAMRRPYRLEDFREVVSKFRKVAPQGGLTSDVIAGFPGETEGAFRNTLDLLRELDFLDFHPFPYSDRPGTPGEALHPKVPPHVIRERMNALLALKRGCLETSAHKAQGSLRRVIVERHGQGSQAGLTDEGLRLVFPERPGELGQEAWMRVTGPRDGSARAEWADVPAQV